MMSLPPAHLVRMFTHDLKRHEDEIAELRAMVAKLIGRNKRHATFTTTEKTQDGSVEVKQVEHQLETLHDYTMGAKEKYITAVRRLQANGINVSAKNLKQMGIGNGSIAKYRKMYPDNVGFPEEKKKVVEVEKQPTEDDIGYKIVVPEQPEPVPRSQYPSGSAGTKEHKQETKLANQLRTKRKRDIAKFGEANTTTEEECESKGHTIKKKMKVAPGIVRDVCV
jgi:hypothetical protein